MDTGAITFDSIREAEPARTPRLLQRQQSFADSLGRAFQAGSTSPETQARRAAEQLVAAAFVTPLLSQLRNSDQAAPPFAPTQGEKQFRALADSKVAHDIIRGSNLPIVERLTADLLKRTTALKEAQGKSTIEAGVGGVS